MHSGTIDWISLSVFGPVDGASKNRRRPGIDNAVFWAMNTGLGVFAFGLPIDVTTLKRTGASIMGTATLIGIAIMSARLFGPASRASTP